MREQWEGGNGEEDRVGTLRGEFLRGLIFAAAAAGDGFLQGEKGDLLDPEMEQITNATSRTNGKDPSPDQPG